MRALAELIEKVSPAWPSVQEWIAAATNRVEVLPPEPSEVGLTLERLQVTTRSTLGAVAYHTGGLLIDGGWLRVLGSRGPRMTGSLSSWNALGGEPRVAETGLLLVAHDVLGGVFALDGGALGDGRGGAHYFSPDTLRWQDLRRGYSELLQFFLRGDLVSFYAGCRWPRWHEETAQISPDHGFSLYPPRWSQEGKDPSRVSRRPTLMTELVRLQFVAAKQLGAM